MNAPKVGLISNPSSGHNRDRFAALKARVARCPNIVHHITQSVADIDPALDALAQAAPAVLAINGGDGTVAAVLGRLLERQAAPQDQSSPQYQPSPQGQPYPQHQPSPQHQPPQHQSPPQPPQPFPQLPRILLLPGGTANMTAGDVGIRRSLPRAVEALCRWSDANQPSPPTSRRPLLKVTLGTDPAPRYCMFLGAGAVMRGTEYAHREIHSRGLRDDLSLLLSTARTIWGVARNDPAFRADLNLRLQLDGGDPRQHNTLLLAISTLQRLAFGMRPFWGEEDGRVRLMLIEQPCTKFLSTFISIIRGRPNRNAVGASGYFSHNANRVQIHIDGSLNLDGEIIHANGPVCITASEDLEFIQL